MDRKLISWARAVKARNARRNAGGALKVPPLWLFSDRERLADPGPVLRRLPKGLCGLVLRPGGTMSPATWRSALLVCRARRFPVVVAGLPPCRPSAFPLGRHFAGTEAVVRHKHGLATAAAHDPAQLMRAVRARVDCVFLSPAFATLSHPGAAALGPLRWSRLAVASRVPMIALGGIAGTNVQRLGRRGCHGVGAIGALL